MTVPASALYELAESPAAVQVAVTVAAGETWVPTDVTSATLLVRRADGTEVTWAATITAATLTSLTLLHTLAAGGLDVPRGSSGTWSIRPRLVLPSGVIYGRPVALTVASAFQT